VSGTTGLYHFAILVPSRVHLARALRRLVDARTRLQGAADHGVSEAIYLADPDGNGIEIYRDRSRPEWPTMNGRLHMGVDPLDLEALLDESDEGSTGLATGTTVGHVHLHVADLAAAGRFYSTSWASRSCSGTGRARFSSRPAVTTITSASTRGLASVRRLRRPGQSGCGISRSGCRTPARSKK